MTKTKRIHLSLPAELVKRFDNNCKKHCVNRSEAIKRLIMAVGRGKGDLLN